MTNEIKYNIQALCDVFLSSKDITDVCELILSLEDKNHNIINEITIPKETLLKSLIDIFDNQLHNVKEINVYFVRDNNRKLLNGITIF